MLVRTLLLLILLFLVARAIWRLLEGVVQGAQGGRTPGEAGPGTRGPTPAVKMVADPVCGTYVVPGKALSLVRRGETLYFCSERCRAEYGQRAS